MPLTPAMLRQVGQALYGPQWAGPLSDELQVGDRTMRHWQNDDAELPLGLVDELVDLCTRRGNALLELASQLPTGRLAGLPPEGDGMQTQVYGTMRKPGERRKR